MTTIEQSVPAAHAMPISRHIIIHNLLFMALIFGMEIVMNTSRPNRYHHIRCNTAATDLVSVYSVDDVSGDGFVPRVHELHAPQKRQQQAVAEPAP